MNDLDFIKNCFIWVSAACDQNIIFIIITDQCETLPRWFHYVLKNIFSEFAKFIFNLCIAWNDKQV